MGPEKEDLAVLGVLELPRTLAEVVSRTGLPERRCRSILYRFKRRGLVALDGKIWRQTPGGRKQQKELEKTPLGKSSQEGTSPSSSLRERYVAFREQQTVGRRVLKLGLQASKVLQDLDTLIVECRPIPLARPDLEVLEAAQARVRWLVNELKEAKDTGTVHEIENLLKPELDEARRSASQIHARIEELGVFEYVDENRLAHKIEIRCTGCGLVQTHTLFAEQGEAKSFNCENPKCGLEGSVMGRPGPA